VPEPLLSEPSPGTPDSAGTVLAQLETLPTLPGAVVRLLERSADPDVAFSELARLTRGDQALSARILRFANAAGEGNGHPIDTLEDAVKRIGLTRFRGIALTSELFNILGPIGPRGRHAAPRGLGLWQHSLAVACAAEQLARALPAERQVGGDAFLAGLLHDLGKLALCTLFPKAYQLLAASAVEQHDDIADHERDTLGVDHTVAGRELARRWRFPGWPTDLIWLHHLAPHALPQRLRTPALLVIVQVADTLARELHLGFSGNHRVHDSAASLAGTLGIAPGVLDQIAARLPHDVAEWSHALGLNDTPGAALTVAALQQANAELGRLHDAAAAQRDRLAIAARYYNALATFVSRSTDDDSAAERATGVAGALAAATQRRFTVALLVDDPARTLTIATQRDGVVAPARRLVTADPTLHAWLSAPPLIAGAWLSELPAVLRRALAPELADSDSAPLVFLPLSVGGDLHGGVVLAEPRDTDSPLSAQREWLQPLLASLAQQLAQTARLRAAQHLSDELADTNRRLQRSQFDAGRQKLIASIAELAAGAGHELNNPLAVISGRAQMLQLSHHDETVRKTLGLIIEKAHTCSRIVTELMEFARPRPLTWEQVDLADLLATARRTWLAEAELPESRVSVKLAPNLSPLRADRAQLEIVLRELLRNATEATADNGGVIQLGAVCSADGRSVEVAVRDAGRGMTPSTLERVFDPFYSNRPAGRGRGLGLPRAQRIVHAHGGSIRIESRPGSGATVFIRLPVEPQPPD
jgi:putative nucleotidyltransferase with HDIG domain